MRALAFGYRLISGGLFGAQLFFAAVAAQVAFPREVAALPAGDPRKALAGDLVGQMLGALDRITLSGAALAVACAVLVGRQGALRATRAALLPLFAGLCAAASMLWITPSIHAMRAAGQTGLPAFGRLHAISASLLVAEMLLWLVAVWRAHFLVEPSSHSATPP